MACDDGRKLCTLLILQVQVQATGAEPVLMAAAAAAAAAAICR